MRTILKLSFASAKRLPRKGLNAIRGLGGGWELNSERRAARSISHARGSENRLTAEPVQNTPLRGVVYSELRAPTGTESARAKFAPTSAGSVTGTLPGSCKCRRFDSVWTAT